MNGRTIALALAALTLSLSACESTPSISADATPGVNFSAYKTYTMVNAKPPAGVNPVAYERILQNVQSQMAAKGYTMANPADLSVILTVGAKDKTDIDTWGRWGMQTDVYQYTEGKLSVDVFDTNTKQPLWHGTATSTIDPNKSDPAMIDKATTGVMAKFPGRAA